MSNLRQAENKVRIEGILSEINVDYKSFIKDGRSTEAIGGNIVVQVEQELDNAVSIMEIPVYMFATKYKKDGGINPAFESIEKVKNEFVSIAACGNREQADKIRITNGDIRMNEYYNQNGTLVSFPRINATFIYKVNGAFKPEASFTVEFVVGRIARAVDTEGVELDPPKLLINTVLPQYGGKVDIIPFVATKPGVISAIEQYWDRNYTYRASGKLNFTTTTTVIKDETDFGDGVDRTVTRTVNELVITGGSQSPIEGDAAFDLDEVTKALSERQAVLDNLKNKQKTPTSVPKVNATREDLGF